MNGGEFLRKYELGFRLFLAVVLSVVLPLSIAPFARAASVTSFSDVLSTIEESVVANHTITFTLADDWTDTDTLSIDFPDTFNTSVFDNNDEEDFDITDDGAEQTLVAASGCSGAADEIELTTVNTTTDTFTFTRCASDATIASGSVVVIEIGTNATTGGTGNDQITNQSAAQNNSDALVSLTSNFGASGTLALEIVADNNLVVTGTIDPQISCAIDDNTAAFGTFTLATVETADSTPIWTISTNAANGYSLRVRDIGNGSGTAGLYNSVANYTITSQTEDLNSNPSGYGLQGTKTDGDAGSATTTIAAPFTATGTNVGALVTTAFPGAGTLLASATGAVSNATITSTLKAKVSGLDAAGSYEDTLTYVCTGIY